MMFIVHPEVAEAMKEAGIWNDDLYVVSEPIKDNSTDYDDLDDLMKDFFKNDPATLNRREVMSQEITDFMIDLETFGTGHNAVIVGIGLAGFNLETGVITPMLDLTVDPTSCMEAGLKADGDTILWWMRQSDAARAKINTNRITLQEALFEVQDCMRAEGVKLDKDGNSDARVWGNGIRADNVWLASAFAACGMPTPWGFWNDRDVRTIRDLAISLGCEDFKKTIEFSGTPHCALADAVHQAKYVCSYALFLRQAGQALADRTPEVRV